MSVFWASADVHPLFNYSLSDLIKAQDSGHVYSRLHIMLFTPPEARSGVIVYFVLLFIWIFLRGKMQFTSNISNWCFKF